MRELLHMCQHTIDPGHDILPIDHDGSVGPVPERHMQHRPILCEVDLLPIEHAVPCCLYLAG